MRSKFPIKKYLLLAGFLFLLISLPPIFVHALRGKTIAFLSPFFRKVHLFHGNHEEILQRLEGENHFLRIEIGKLRALLDQHAAFESTKQQLGEADRSLRRYEETAYLADLQAKLMPARVIYRDPGNWTSSFWINIGEDANKQLGRIIIGKNSPVLLGKAVVGAIDYVGKKQSRVRLITDVGVKPSVRAARGHSQHRLLLDYLEPILRHLYRSNLSISENEKEDLIHKLEIFRQSLLDGCEDVYLAKGILQGVKAHTRRQEKPCLRGIGFNYDFGDEEGPARELISGKPIDESNLPALPIIKINDLLVTTGMDGVFPPGLRVAEVTRIFPLREGAYTYEIEAMPVVANLDVLQTVFVLPPLGFEEQDQPIKNMPEIG